MNRMLRIKSKMADGEVSSADSNTSLQAKKSGYTFGQNETLLLISLYQKYKENCCDNGCNGSLFVGRHICYAMFTRPEPTVVFLCKQSELFLAFRTNHSYSRIVDKKTRPRCSGWMESQTCDRNARVSNMATSSCYFRLKQSTVKACLHMYAIFAPLVN